MYAPLRVFIRLLVTVFFIATLLVVILWLAPNRSVQHDPARDLPWKLPDYRVANTSFSVASNGQLKITIEHPPLVGVTPAMVAWFYQNLPISTVELNGTTRPLYHIFHPSEHGSIRILEPASNGSPGMGPGALVQREEWFGPYDSKGSARITAFSDSGMTAVPEIAGLQFGEIIHSFESHKDGTRYRVQATLGSETPVIGPLFNLYLRKKIFHQAMLEQWLRHQVQEVSSLPFFLPQLYTSEAPDNHFTLSIDAP